MSLIKGRLIISVKSPIRCIYGLGLFLLFILQPVISTGLIQKKASMVQHELVVAKINTIKDKDCTEVVFLRSARFYKLFKTLKHYDHYLELLKESEKDNFPVVVGRNSETSDTIISVEKVKNGKSG